MLYCAAEPDVAHRLRALDRRHQRTLRRIVLTLNNALVKALDDKQTRERLMDLGGVIPDKPDRSPKALQALVKNEVARWARVFRGPSH